jgi:two-component system, response regulator PdtaR
MRNFVRFQTDRMPADRELLSLLARPNVPAPRTPLAQFPKDLETVRFRTLNQERFRSVFRFILSWTSGKKERAPLQAARKAVTVLVVEDDWLIRENMVTDLRQEGWAVLEAATGVGALTALHDAQKVDLLITDIGLADAWSGWDVAEAFRIAQPDAPVIYTSGNTANDHRRVSGSIFLSKPVAVSELTATCRTLLARRVSS